MKEALQNWLAKANLGPNQKKLVELLSSEVKDDEDAGLLHTLLEKIRQEKG